MCVRVWVGACVWVRVYMCVGACVLVFRARARVCVCACIEHVYVCVCVCVCLRVSGCVGVGAFVLVHICA